MSWIKCVVKTYLYQEKGVSLVRSTKVGCKWGIKSQTYQPESKKVFSIPRIHFCRQTCKDLCWYAIQCQNCAYTVFLSVFAKYYTQAKYCGSIQTYNLSAFWNILGMSLLFFRTDVDISCFLKNICINIEHQHIKAATYKSIAQYNLKGNKLVTRILNIALNVCGTLQC